MPERITTWWQWFQEFSSPLLFAFVGIFIGIGQLLLSGEVLSWRIIVGRALSTGGIAMAAGAVLVWVPELSLAGQIGVAAGLASLGTSGLERLFARALQGRG